MIGRRLRTLIITCALCYLSGGAIAQQGAEPPHIGQTQAPTTDITGSDKPAPTPTKSPRPDNEGAQPSEGPAARDQRGAKQEPLSVKLIPGDKTETEAQKEKYETEEKPALDRGLTSYTGWLAIFTALLFISASIQAGLFIWQLLLIRDSLKDSRMAAQAAGRSAEIADQSMKSSNRAFVFVDHHHMHRNKFPVDDDERPYIFTTVWRNGGKSWTIKGVNHISFGSDIVDLPVDFDFADGDVGGMPPASFLIGPNSTIVGATIQVPYQIVSEAISGSRKLYFWGWCEYDDIFTGTPRHRTEFCVKLIAEDVETVGEPGARSVTIRFAHHHKYNGADEDCLKPIQT